MTDKNPARALATKIARFGVGAEWREEVAPQVWWAALPLLVEERLTGLAGAAAAGGALVLDDLQRAQLRQNREAATTRVLALERLLLRFADEASREGIELVVLKGPVLAHRFYPDPSWRSFNDLDVLVRAADWRRACAVLQGLGFTRELPEPRPGFDERFGKAAAHFDDAGLCVDLHRTLVLGAFGVWLDCEALFARAAPFQLAGIPLTGLDDTTVLLHACMHASLGWSPPLLQPLRDVVQVASNGAVDWDRFAREAEEWRMGVVVKHSFDAVRNTLDLELPSEAVAVAATLRQTTRERKALAAYEKTQRSRGGMMRSTLGAIRGIGSKAAFVWDLTVPDQAFLAARTAEGARPSYARRLATPIRWLLRRSG